MLKIQKVHGREIIDSRGNPTVEVDVTLEGGAFGRAAVPRARRPGSAKRWSCATATRSAISGKGVTKAVGHVNGEIAKALIGTRGAINARSTRR